MTARPARAVAAVAAVSLLVTACGGGDEAAKPKRPAAAAALATGSFVGTATATKGGLVGVVVAPAPSGRGRQVQAYLCSPEDRVFEWFAGSVPGGRVALRNENGSSLQASVAPGRANGTIALRSGRRIAFAAHAARGIEGLYELIISSDGRFDGASATGAQVQGKVEPTTAGGPPGTTSERYTAPNGQVTTIAGPATFVPAGSRADEVVLIVAGRTRVGGGKRRTTNFVDPSAAF